MSEKLHQLDLSQRSDREPILFIVHENLLQRDCLSCLAALRLVYFSESSLAQFANDLVVENA